MRLRRCRPSIHPRRSPWSSCPAAAAWPITACGRRGVPRSLLIRPLASTRQTRRHGVQPVRDGFIARCRSTRGTQRGALSSIPPSGRITDIALQPGEQLVGAGPYAGDTVRWIIGDTGERIGGNAPDPHHLVKPTRADLVTNLVINTQHAHLSRRAALDRAHLYGASVSWQYPQDQLICAAPSERAEAQAAQPVASGVDLANVNFPLCDRGRPCAVATTARLRRRT